METVSRGKKWIQPVGTKSGWRAGVGQGLDESILQGGGGGGYPCHLKFKVHAMWLKQPVDTKKGWQPPSEVASHLHARINDTEIPPPSVFTPCYIHTHAMFKYLWTLYIILVFGFSKYIHKNKKVASIALKFCASIVLSFVFKLIFVNEDVIPFNSFHLKLFENDFHLLNYLVTNIWMRFFLQGVTKRNIRN